MPFTRKYQTKKGYFFLKLCLLLFLLLLHTLKNVTFTHKHIKLNPPMRGTESDVAGIISATRSMKTVSESNTVMPK